MELRPEAEESVDRRLVEGRILEQHLVDELGVDEVHAARPALAIPREKAGVLEPLEVVGEVRSARVERRQEARGWGRSLEVQMKQERAGERLAQEREQQLFRLRDRAVGRLRDGRVAALVAALEADRDQALSAEAVEMVVEGPDRDLQAAPDLAEVDSRVLLDEGEQRLGPGPGPRDFRPRRPSPPTVPASRRTGPPRARPQITQRPAGDPRGSTRR